MTVNTNDHINEENQINKSEILPIKHCKNLQLINQVFSTKWRLAVLFAGLAISTTLIISSYECQKCFTKLNHKNEIDPMRKIYWVYSASPDAYYLKILDSVLKQLGYQKSQSAGILSSNWDLCWAYRYPFNDNSFATRMKNIKPHQKVSQFPGNGILTHKANLATSGLKYVPPGFKLPRDKDKFDEYVRLNPNARFVQKNVHHKYINIISLKDGNLTKAGTFIQTFVENPLLIDGHKFDIGVYTIITSLNPLRVYIYNGESLVKYCKEKYYPFDPKNLDKYVVVDPYLPTWEMPALKQYHIDLGFGLKDTFNAYLQSKGINPSSIWDQIEDAIRTVLLATEPVMLKTINRLNSSKVNFFELVRFDFVVDEDLKVYLMEVNMSPNLWSADWTFNRMLYRQLIYNMFSLVGVSERIFRNSLKNRSQEEEEMIVSDKHLLTYPGICSNKLCNDSCASLYCQLCKPCISSEVQNDLTRAYKEHIHQGDCKRIFPPSMTEEEALQPVTGNFSAVNELHYTWFKGKCLLDSSWC